MAFSQIEEVILAFFDGRIYNLHLKGIKVFKRHLNA